MMTFDVEASFIAGAVCCSQVEDDVEMVLSVFMELVSDSDPDDGLHELCSEPLENELLVEPALRIGDDEAL